MSYYYLLAGLPNLTLSSESKPIDTEEVIDTIYRNLKSSDRKLLRYVLYPNDNRNLLNAIFHRFKNYPQEEFLSPAVYSTKQIKEYHINKEMFPSYMEEFLREYEDQFEVMSMREMDDRLWQMFYEEVEKQNPFIADYYDFEKTLKELFSVYNHSYLDWLSVPTLSEGNTLEQVGKGKSISASILRRHPHIEAVDEAISSNNPTDIEKLMEQIKWDYLDEISGFFGREQVMVYALRLLMIQRWQRLTPDTGVTRFKALQDNIKNNVSSLKTYLT